MHRNLIISIIGRPNVGKSSIFNTFIRHGKKAITHDRPGITRDRHYALATLEEVPSLKKQDFILVDTGGFFPDRINEKMVKEDYFYDIMTDHAKLAIEESDLVLFIVDVKDGLTPFDLSIAEEIRKSKKDFWLVINKVDNPETANIYDFYRLGLEEDQIYSVSAAHARGLTNFKECLHKKLNAMEKTSKDHYLQLGVTPRDKVVSRVALIGSPNAGKSTLLNQLIGQKRALVSEIAGTTLDPIEGFFDLYFGEDSLLLNDVVFTKEDRLLLKDYESFQKNNEKAFSIDQVFDDNNLDDANEVEIEAENNPDETIVKNENNNEVEVEIENVTETEAPSKGSFWRTIHLVDTAGIRKKSLVQEVVEEKSVFRSLRCITESDISLIMVDGTIGISHHDRRLIDIALDKGKSIIIALNKIDLLKEKLDTNEKKQEWIDDIKAKYPWLEFCAIVPISAKYKKGIGALKKVLKQTTIVRHQKIPTGILNKTVSELVDKNPVTVERAGGAILKLKYVSQLKSNPPTFLLFTNKSRGIPDNYQRYLKNGIRKSFSLVNTPVHLIFRTSTELEKRAAKFKGIQK